MPLIIDTYNVLHVIGVLPPELAGIDTNGLVRLLAGSRYGREEAILVCDGPSRDHAPPGRTGNVLIRYSGHGRSADDLIARLIRKSSDPRRLTIVTADREIQRAARRRRCRILDSASFLRQLGHDAATPGGPAPKDLTSALVDPDMPTDTESWLREFDIDEDTDLTPPPLPPTLDPSADEPRSPAPTSRPPPPPPPQPPEEPRRPAVDDLLPPSVIEDAEQLLENDDER